MILRVLFFPRWAIETQVCTSAISQVHKFYSFATTSHSQYFSSPFSRDHRLVIFFVFSQYSYREGAIQFAYSSSSIRSNSIELTRHISASKESVFSSAHIRGSRCSGYNNIWVRNEIFAAIQSSKSYSRLIRASARFIAPSLYIIRKLNWDKISA